MRTRIVIQNLKCGGCAKTIVRRLEEEQDVITTEVLLEDNAVVVTHDAGETPIRVKNILKQLGYPSLEEDNGMMARARSVLSCAGGRWKE